MHCRPAITSTLPCESLYPSVRSKLATLVPSLFRWRQGEIGADPHDLGSLSSGVLVATNLDVTQNHPKVVN